MNGLVRKMCILKQQKAGFSPDGSPVGGVARVECYSGVLTLQLSLINFAPLTEGRYVCILCDKAGEKIIFPLTPGVNLYKTERTPFAPDKGFCCMVAYLHTEAVCVAVGQFGAGNYSVKLLTDGLVGMANKPTEKVSAPVQTVKENAERKVVFEQSNITDVPPMPEFMKVNTPPMPENYNDEVICDENYFERERGGFTAHTKDAEIVVADGQIGTAGGKMDEHENDLLSDLFRPLTHDAGQSYYLQVKEELEGLFATGKRSKALLATIPNSEWVQIDENNGCLVGLIYEELQVRYIAYALPAKGKSLPKGMEKACFVPADPLAAQEGYFVLFQDAATGECVQAFGG